MKRILLLLLLPLTIIGVSYAQPKNGLVYNYTNCFPLSKDIAYRYYQYVILLDDKKVIQRYKPYFDKYQLNFNGYVWEEVLTEILSHADNEIMQNVVLKPQNNSLSIKIIKYEVIKRFPQYVCPALNNMKIFNNYLKHIDKAKVNNY